MIKRKSIQFLLVGWFTFSIFLSYSGHFVPISPFYYLSIGVVLIALLEVFNEVKVLYLASGLKIVVLFTSLLVLGLLFTRAPGFGTSKILILSCWLIFFIFYAGIISLSFDLFVKMTIFWGIVFVGILFNNFGDPYHYLQYLMQHPTRLAIYEGDDIAFNPIWIARFLGYIFLFVFFYVFEKKHYKVIGGGVLVVLFLYMIATGSKGPLVALIISLLFFLSKQRWYENFKYIIPAFVISIVFFLILHQLGFFKSHFFADRFSSETGSVSSRENFINQAFGANDWFHFILGSGTGDFGFLINKKDASFYPHNIFAELFYENGLIGIVCLLVIIFKIFSKRIVVYLDSRLKLVFALFLFFLINAQTSGSISGNQYLFLSYILFFTMLSVFQTNQFMQPKRTLDKKFNNKIHKETLVQ